jgi:plastocyanin
MLQFVALIALAAQAIAVPQGGPAAPASGGSGKTFNVMVGNGGPKFDPANLTQVANGDTIVFHFMGQFKHSITQSTFAAPCTPAPGGFNSGLLGNDSQFSLTITDASKPLWFYCQQTTPAKHCGMGMVGSINAVSDPNGNTFDKFLAAAKNLGNNEPAQTPASVLSAAVATGTIQAASNASSPTNSNSGANPTNTAPANGGSGGNNKGAAGMVKLSMTGLCLGLTVVLAALSL